MGRRDSIVGGFYGKVYLRNMVIAFIIWAAVGCMFVGIGISCFLAKKATGFWANAKMFEVTDVKTYNHAMGKLWCIFGVVFIALGLPLLSGQSLLIGVALIGVIVEVLALMIIYTLVIEKKYRKR